jgi:hypothetical protein
VRATVRASNRACEQPCAHATVRASNKDSFGYDLERRIYVVCDAWVMAPGKVTSATAVRNLLESRQTNPCMNRL